VTERQPSFQLSGNIEHYLAALSKLYAQDGKRQELEIIVNSQVRVHEQWSYDNWNGGTHGHALFLTIPESLYLQSVKRRDELQNEIRDDLNKLHNVQNEFIDSVFLEMETSADRDWRKESGILQSGQRTIAPEASARIWGDGGYRVFLSHKAEVKKEAADIKKRLAAFGISSFVAHEDIEPTKEWQDEIENALASMDAFVALMTTSFHDSLWTDQEVGFAIGRRVPIIAAKLGRDPYGFIGKFQALSCTWDNAPVGVVSLLIRHSRMLDAFIDAAENCTSFDHGNALSVILPEINSITDQQAQRLCQAFNQNHELHHSFGFNGYNARYYGNGLAFHLSRITGRSYAMTDSGDIQAP
jgi:TIR domain